VTWRLVSQSSTRATQFSQIASRGEGVGSPDLPVGTLVSM
jgi:hypothetical protein